MSENDNKDDSNFEFIKEQVIERKRRRIKKRLLPLLATIVLAVLFGLIAAITFAITEPNLYQLLHKDDETKPPFSFPTQGTDSSNNAAGNNVNQGSADNSNAGNNGPAGGNEQVKPTPTPVIQTIDASLDDFFSVYGEINQVAQKANNSIVNVTSTFTVVDWLFGSSGEKSIDTTGVVVAGNSKNYMILVSLDRVKDANSIKIKLSDFTYVDAAIQDYDKDLNIALLSVAIQDIPKVYMSSFQIANIGDSDMITVGTPVVAIGNPNGYINSMEIGMVTSKGSYANITDNKMELFNTSVACNEHSDGVILNFEGKIIGWITRTLEDEENKEVSSVVGINELKQIINQMCNQEPRIYFGIKALDMTQEVKDDHKVAYGIYVNAVQADSPAFKAGLKDGDIILAVNDRNIQSTEDFYDLLASCQAGDELSVKLQRVSGDTEKQKDLKVKLSEKSRKNKSK